MSAPIVEVVGLGKRHRAPRAGLGRAPESGRGVHDVSLTVGRGEAWLIAGPNGAGKSTTLQCIIGLLRPDRGSLRVCGEPPRRARRHIGYQPEIFYAHPFLTARQCLAFHGRLAGMAAVRIRARTEAVLAELDLEAAADARVGSLSKGTLQRLGLAQSILDAPQLLVWDEPTSGLDPLGRRRVRELARRLKGEGRTLLISTHGLGEVEDVCEHAAIFAAGRCLEQGRVADLCAAGGHRDLEALYFAAVGAPPAEGRHA